MKTSAFLTSVLGDGRSTSSHHICDRWMVPKHHWKNSFLQDVVIKTKMSTPYRESNSWPSSSQAGNDGDRSWLRMSPLQCSLKQVTCPRCWRWWKMWLQKCWSDDWLGNMLGEKPAPVLHWPSALIPGLLSSTLSLFDLNFFGAVL